MPCDVSYISYKKGNSPAIVLSWPIQHGNWFVLNKLKNGEPCSCPTLSYGSEATALAYSVFEIVSHNLTGDPKVQENSGVSSVCCNIQNDHFIITAVCPKAFGNIKKVLRLMLNSIVPHKMYKLYSKNIALLNAKSVRDEFNHLVNEMYTSLNKCEAVVIGNVVKLESKDVLKALDDYLSSYCKWSKVDDKGRPPYSLVKEKGKTSYPTFLVNMAVANNLLAMYIEDVHGCSSVVNSNEVIVKASKQINVNKDKLKATVLKFDKLKEPHAACLYLAAKNCTVDAQSAKKFMKDKKSMNEIAAAVILKV